MDIIFEFESKLKNIGGEKLFSAREIMHLFGYSKWERFLGAIHRAKDGVPEKEISKNFFFVVDTQTGGRPKEDVLLTLGGCYLVLQNADQRKENVGILLGHLQNLFSEEKLLREQKKHKKIFQIPKERFFLYLFGFFALLTLWFYGKNFFYFFTPNYQDKNIMDFLTQKEFVIQKQKEEEIYDLYDSLLQQDLNTPDFGQQIGGIFQEKLDEYIGEMHQNGVSLQKNQEEYISFLPDFNWRTDFSQKILGEDLIQSYFLFGNRGAYKDSCSLLSPKFCLSGSVGDFREYAPFWKKTLDGYNIQNIQQVKNEEEKSTYCVTYSYRLAQDLSNEYIIETFQFATQKKGGYEQITGRYCERIEKGGKDLKCPFELTNYLCS